MIKVYYDLHIHTALSPCADKDMTPNNIINMSAIKGLDVIAITDHNSIDNCLSCIQVGEKNGILVIPAMELQTKEEIHLLCLFRSILMLEHFYEIIADKLGTQENLPDFFGKQLILDEKDCIIGENHRLLITSVSITLEEAVEKISSLGGIAVPAHIDKRAYSIIANLGFIPNHLPINTIELSKKTDIQAFRTKHPGLKSYTIVQNSDAHYLWEISEREHYLEVNELTMDEFFLALSGKGHIGR